MDIQRPLLALLLVTLSALPVLAQRSGIGIKGGPLMSDTRSGAIRTHSLAGGTAGLYFPLRAGDRLELQPELLIAALGAEYSLPDGASATVRTYYAQLPLSAKYFFNNSLNVQGGVQLGRLIAAKQQSEDGSTDITDAYNKMDLGLVLGAGFDMISGFDLTVRYYNGMKPVIADDISLFPRNRAFMLTAGYRIASMRAMRFERKRH